MPALEAFHVEVQPAVPLLLGEHAADAGYLFEALLNFPGVGVPAIFFFFLITWLSYVLLPVTRKTTS